MAHLNHSSSSVIHRRLGQTRLQSTQRNFCFLTDVEGNLNYFHRFVEMSECLSWNANKHNPHSNQMSLVLHEDYDFVYGGDASDKGPGSIRFLKYLLQLKANYGERVQWLMGNRDLNKMRFTSELSEEALKQESVYSQSPAYWLHEGDDLKISPMEFLSQHGLANSRTNRLRWMLRNTMGSATDFEFRRDELKAMGEIPDDLITDEVVTQSYLNMVQNPDVQGSEMGTKSDHGLWTQYLRLGKLAMVIQSVLLVHGGIFGDFRNAKHQTALGYIPGQPTLTQDQLLNVEAQGGNIRQWTQELNAFAQDQIQIWEDERDNSHAFSPMPTHQDRAGNVLMDYGLTTGKPTVVTARPLEGGMPVSLRPEEVSILAKNEIKIILSGHTPHGTSPTVIPSVVSDSDMMPPTKVTTVLADTSYSHVNYIKPGIDNRGLAVSEVIVNPEDGSYFVHGVLEDETEIYYSNLDPYVGQMLSNGYFVKAKLGKKPEEDAVQIRDEIYLICKVTGYKYEYDRWTGGEIEDDLRRVETPWV